MNPHPNEDLLAYSAVSRVESRMPGGRLGPARLAAPPAGAATTPPRRYRRDDIAGPVPLVPLVPSARFPLIRARCRLLSWRILASWRIVGTPVPKNFQVANIFQDLFLAGRIRLHLHLIARTGTATPRNKDDENKPAGTMKGSYTRSRPLLKSATTAAACGPSTRGKMVTWSFSARHTITAR